MFKRKTIKNYKIQLIQYSLADPYDPCTEVTYILLHTRTQDLLFEKVFLIEEGLFVLYLAIFDMNRNGKF